MPEPVPTPKRKVPKALSIAWTITFAAVCFASAFLAVLYYFRQMGMNGTLAQASLLLQIVACFVSVALVATLFVLLFIHRKQVLGNSRLCQVLLGITSVVLVAAATVVAANVIQAVGLMPILQVESILVLNGLVIYAAFGKSKDQTPRDPKAPGSPVA